MKLSEYDEKASSASSNKSMVKLEEKKEPSLHKDKIKRKIAISNLNMKDISLANE